MKYEAADCGLLIKLICEKVVARANQELAAEELTASQAHVLMMLYHSPDYQMKVKDLEQRFRMAQSTIAGLSARLEAKELVRKAPSTDRYKHIQLTQKGIARCRRSIELIQAIGKQMTSRLTAQEKKELIRMLNLVYEAVADGQRPCEQGGNA